MSEFGKRYRKYCFNRFIRSLNTAHYLAAAAACLLVLLYLGCTDGAFGFITGIFQCAFWLFLILIIVPAAMMKNTDLLSVLDTYGFSREYLIAFEKAKIINKPFNLKDAAEYAEIFYRIGQPADAIRYLNTIDLPKKEQNSARILYFYVYVMSALSIRNPYIAEDMKNRSTQSINDVKSYPKYADNVYLVYLALAATEIFAGQYDSARLRYGYDILTNYLNSPSYKKSNSDCLELEILKVYTLVKLERSSEAEDLFREVRRKAASDMVLLRAVTASLLDELQKAQQGIMPLIG